MPININNLLIHKDEILKAEIVSLFTLLDKTFVSWWQYVNNEYFKGISTSYSDRDTEIKNLLSVFFNDLKINIEELNVQDKNGKIKEIDVLNDFINTKWREWRGVKLNDEPKKILQVIYGSSEGLNSGIEKGAPKEECHIRGDKPYLANSFGTFKKIVNKEQLDDLRGYLSKHNVKDIEGNIKKILELNDDSYFKELDNGDNLQQILSKSKTCTNISKIRKKVYTLIKLLYGFTPSDSRFPSNDTSLYDQAYMSSSMFKATLAGLFLDNSQIKNLSKFDYRTTKWRILGIQYDKLGLAEKGHKPSQISWYRNTSEEIDNKIKELLEVKYPIGNEIYRDETGIYFLVSENLGKENDDNLTELKEELKEIENEILRIFKNLTDDEFYPSIHLTKPSRGLMNLTYLLENAKENFLKIKWELKEKNLCLNDLDNKNAVGVCSICGTRLVYREDKEKMNEKMNICKYCYEEKTKGRVKEWLEDTKEETIWTGELQDKNGRIALITLKFELNKWLNGDLLNSLAVRKEDFDNYRKIIKNLINLIKKSILVEEVKGLNLNDDEIKKIMEFLSLFDVEAIKKPFKESFDKLKDYRNIANVNVKYRDTVKRLLKNEEWIEHFKFYDKDAKKIIKNKRTGEMEKFNEYDIKNGIKKHLYKIFTINYLILQIQNILLERSIGGKWEEFIYKSLNDWDEKGNKPKKEKIDFDKRIIYWYNLEDKDIEILSTLILQFLLRKNPSPARLRRIWETTREFFEQSENEIINLLRIPDWRQKRLIIQLDENEKRKPDGEYRYSNIDFWKKGSNLYLISSIEQFLKVVGNDHIKKLLNKGNNEELNEKLKKEVSDLLSIKEIELKKHDENSSENSNLININLISDNIRIELYKPYFSIIKPTPISWQFIIPAEYVPKLIENIQNEYYKNFKWVYGKLPLHVGVVIQKYDKPLYMGINALRRIRRDLNNLENIKTEIDGKSLKSIQKELYSKYATGEEVANNTEKYYSLYEWNGEGKTYHFYLIPDKKGLKWITTTDRKDNSTFYIYPNTFDFEFLDTNSRRNDISYYNGKRILPLKSNRPYNLEDWEKFKTFKEIFKDKSSKVQKLVSVIYEHLENWDEDNSKSITQFLTSSFINILELNKKSNEKVVGELCIIFDIELEHEPFIEKLQEKINKNAMLMFIDMFNFWHSGLKEM